MSARSFAAALGLIAGLSALVACTGSPPPAGSGAVLGALELGVDPGVSATRTPINPGAAVQGTLADSAVTLTPTAFTITDSRGIRYFNQSFSVKNNTATAFKNLSVVLYHKAAENIGGTAIKNLQNFAGTALTGASQAQRIKPANAMTTPVTVNTAKADFQSFTSAEAAQIQSDARTLGVIGNSDTVLEYGFVARSGTARGIAAGATGEVTLAFRIPKTGNTNTEPYRFVVTAVIFDAPTTRVTRSREETAASAAARAAAISDRSTPTEVALIGKDTETATCTNCNVTRRDNLALYTAGGTLLDAPSSVQFNVETVKTGLGLPWSLNFAPDGTLYFTERGSSVVAVKSLDVNSGTVQSYTSTAAVRVEGEGGVLGMALDPSFASNNQVYICYSYWLNGDSSSTSNRRNRLSRFTISGSSLGSEQILFDNMLGWFNHNGCRVQNGPDGKLYLSIGDAAAYPPGPTKAQDPNVLAGKIFRINYDGSIPTDNPLYGSLSGQARALYSFGHRNPQGLAFQPDTGALWSTEHGENTRDELNLIAAGKNYGWPSCIGSQALNTSINADNTTYTCTPSTNLTAANYAPAKHEYNSDVTLAVSDIVFSTSGLFPEWKSQLFMVTLKTGRLTRIEVNASSFVSDQILIDNTYGRLRDVTVGPDGFIYFSNDSNTIYRVIPK